MNDTDRTTVNKMAVAGRWPFAFLIRQSLCPDTILASERDRQVHKVSEVSRTAPPHICVSYRVNEVKQAFKL